MHLQIKSIDHGIAREILSWRYEKPYNFYNNEETDEAIQEFLNGAYRALIDMNNEVFGFFCTGESAQVPAGYEYGVYKEKCVDMGLGMNPDEVGKGKGTDFCTYIVNYFKENYEGVPIRLTVATYNKRAIHLYEKTNMDSLAIQEMLHLGGNVLTADFYCEEVFSGRTKVNKVLETENILAYHHTKPAYPVHIVAVPKKHISSLITLEEEDNELLLELLGVIKRVAKKVTEDYGACRIITNLGNYQDSKHLHWHIVSGSPIK